MTQDIDDKGSGTERFWEDIYLSKDPGSNGRPTLALENCVETLEPGRALDLGCAKGDDAVWLAQRGWSVVAVDISSTALRYAQANAERSHVSTSIEFEQHDLAKTFPEGGFDLVTALFLHSPLEFNRSAVLARAADAVSPNGHLLIVEHASRAPWSWDSEDAQYPDAEQTLACLGLKLQKWARVQVGTVERLANGPDGQSAIVRDNIILLRRGFES